jgi:hypothetical protein
MKILEREMKGKEEILRVVITENIPQIIVRC